MIDWKDVKEKPKEGEHVLIYPDNGPVEEAFYTLTRTRNLNKEDSYIPTFKTKDEIFYKTEFGYINGILTKSVVFWAYFNKPKEEIR